MTYNGQNYTFTWEELSKYCDSEQKKFEGTEISVFLENWGVDFEVLILWTYQNALDLGTGHNHSKWCATHGAMRDLDVRSWERFYAVKKYVEDILDTYTPERGEEATYIFSWHMAQHGHYRRIPKRFQHLLIGSCS